MKDPYQIKDGFTLVELLVVIAIIAALAGIAVPVSSSMIAKGREAACLGNLRSIGVGLQSYLSDHNQKLPEMALGRESKSSGEPVLETVLLEYLESPEVFHCPADKEQFEKTGSSYNWNHTQNGLHISQVAFFGIEAGRSEAVPLVSDKESWHPEGTNFLYADSTSSNKVRFATNRGK
ncbi:prepilin-type N-terminal cleavage/methylation domain-containing protein [Luteolibacter algae]|uniref:Prepilin-type N-terminal cleavage/methylation domain-containing protein n=1 Tax=Luteolibacter algae TaxID=454151 RepID=A0ABW5D215_9BACT